MKVFIETISPISIQEPLCEKWFSDPIMPAKSYNLSIEPDYKEFVSPIEARRMGKLLKRAVATALHSLKNASETQPEAIIIGTGLGCVEHTEKFLNAVIDNDEECLSPTSFMLSTHNTISSQVAQRLKCHNYNCTYSHRALSFDNALFDALMQMELGKISNALIGGHDEMTPAYYTMLGRIGYWKKDEDCSTEKLRKSRSHGSISGDCSVSMFLNNKQTAHSQCSIEDMEMFYKPTLSQIQTLLSQMLQKNNLKINDIDGIVCGLSGDAENDHTYQNIISQCCPNVPLIWYKHLFGESCCASALGTYVAATCLKKQLIPSHLLYNQKDKSITKPKNLLVYNHFKNIDHSLILLSSCCN